MKTPSTTNCGNFEKYLPMNPMFPAATFVEAGVVSATNDIMPLDEFAKTRFYKEWVEPQGITDSLAVNLEKGVTRTSLINIRMDTSYGLVDDEARRRMSVLVPHLQRAVADQAIICSIKERPLSRR